MNSFKKFSWNHAKIFLWNHAKIFVKCKFFCEIMQKNSWNTHDNKITLQLFTQGTDNVVWEKNAGRRVLMGENRRISSKTSVASWKVLPSVVESSPTVDIFFFFSISCNTADLSGRSTTPMSGGMTSYPEMAFYESPGMFINTYSIKLV